MLLGNTMILPEGACWHHDEMITREGPAARWKPEAHRQAKRPGERGGEEPIRLALRCGASDSSLPRSGLVQPHTTADGGTARVGCLSGRIAGRW